MSLVHCLAHGHMLRLMDCQLHVLTVLIQAAQVSSLSHRFVSSGDPVQEQSGCQKQDVSGCHWAAAMHVQKESSVSPWAAKSDAPHICLRVLQSSPCSTCT